MVELQVRLTLLIDGEERIVTLSKADAEQLQSELSAALGPRITINPPALPHYVPVPYPAPYVAPRPWYGDWKITCGTSSTNCSLRNVTSYHCDAPSLLP
jgi:hypothetical protein